MKTPKDTLTIMTELVMTPDTNNLGNLHGGKLMYWMDICSAISASKQAEATVVTASVDNVSFHKQIKVGSVVTIESKVTRTFRTSMEVHITVWVHTNYGKERIKSNEAYFTFVALNQEGVPQAVPDITPETEGEKALFDGALRRRQLRLVLGGKLKIEDANELRALLSKA
jgi:acyl-CoA hydrolase